MFPREGNKLKTTNCSRVQGGTTLKAYVLTVKAPGRKHICKMKKFL